MCNYSSDIIIGLTGGISAGLGLWVLEIFREEYKFNKHEKRIVKFLKDNKDKEFEYRNTYRIASSVNLPEDRVKFVCSYSKEIKRSETEKEVWTLINS